MQQQLPFAFVSKGRRIRFALIMGFITVLTGGLSTLTFKAVGIEGIKLPGTTPTTQPMTGLVVPKSSLSSATVQSSDPKAGSILIYPYYTSDTSRGSDTTVTISNVSSSNTVSVHLFPLSTSCTPIDFFICLIPNASVQLKASEFDPFVTGYIIAIALDAAGLPTQANTLIGNALVKENTVTSIGNYVGSYDAAAFKKTTPGSVVSDDGITAAIRWGTDYEAVPNQFSVEIQSPANSIGQRIVTVGLNGNLNASVSGCAQVGKGQVYDQNNLFSDFQNFVTGTCLCRGVVTTTTPDVPGGLLALIPSGRSGTLKFGVTAAVGLIMTPQNSTNAKSGISALPATGVALPQSAGGPSLIIPVLPGSYCAATVPLTGEVNKAIPFVGSGPYSGAPLHCPGTVAFEWDFGDGTIKSTQQYPTHTYSSLGTYNWAMKVTLANGQSCMSSGVIIIKTCTAPVITAQPNNKQITNGGTATLSMTASGTAPLSYQWYEGAKGDPSKPVGTNSNTFTTPALTSTKSYWVRVSNSCGSANSETATVQVGQPNLVANAGNDQNVRLPATVTLDGSGSTGVLSYTWSFIAKPPGSTVTLNNANIAKPTFTPDKTGDYTLKLVATSLRDSAEDMVRVRVMQNTCLRAVDLQSSPVSVTARLGEQKAIKGFGGSGSYNWSLVKNVSGGSLTSTTGSNVNYTAGNTAGVDVIKMADQWCGSIDIPIRVGVPPRVLNFSAPNTAKQNEPFTVYAKFDRAVTQAEVCTRINQVVVPNSCRAMAVDPDATQYRATMSLPANDYEILVRGLNVIWGEYRMARTSVVNTHIPILLLNGYNPSSFKPHPEQWRQFPQGKKSIECQLQNDYFGPSDSCTKQNVTNCDPGKPGPHDNVCVVDVLKPKGDIDTNRQMLESYINNRSWLKSAQKVVLIGHSYGGQISRAYAYWHPNKVKAIFTISTPHTGGHRDVVAARAVWEGIDEKFKAYPDDKALQYFTNGGADMLNQIYKPSTMPNTEIYLTASERINGAFFNKLGNCVAGLVPFSDRVCLAEGSTNSDDAVPVWSQLGSYGLGLGSTYSGLSGSNINRNSMHYKVTDPKVAFHNTVITDFDLWNGFYPQIKWSLASQISPSSSPALAESGFPANQVNLSRAAAVANPALPPAFPQRDIKFATGVLTTSSPNAAVTFPVEVGKDLLVTLVSVNVNPNLMLTGPGGAALTAATVNGLTSIYQLTSDPNGITQAFLIRNPAAGNWTLNIAVPSSANGPNVPVTGAAWNFSAALRSPIQMQVNVPELNYLVGENLKLTASVKNDTTMLTGLTVTASFAPTSGGAATSFILFDDGTHDDGVADDGVYGGNQVMNTVGSFDLTVTASGDSPLGAFQRQQAGTITVSAPETTISNDFTEAAPDDDNDGRYDSVNWNFAVNVMRAGSYAVFGDLAAQDGTTVARATASLNAMAAGNQNITLVFPGQDIYRNGKEGPYLLKNLRVTVATAGGERMSGRPAQTALTGGPYWSWLSFERAETPSLVWQAPVLEQVTRGGSYDLRWLFKDGNGGATVDLYYDTTGSGFAGTAIATGLTATNGEMSYNWNLSALPDGLYYVYARFRNGEFSDAVYGGSVRKITDTDGDGMPDAWETANGLNSNDPSDAYLDPDGDGLANLDEYINNTNPRAADTDGGGESDLAEVTNGRDPLASGDDVKGTTVLAVSPAQGDSRGGDKVMVVGSGFKSGAIVTLGATVAPNVTFINSTKLLVTTPAGNIGAVNVTTVNPANGGTASKTGAFEYLYRFTEPPIAGSNGPICVGGTLNLVASTIPGATYKWTGPNGYTSVAQNPVIAGTTTAASGTYNVTASIDGYSFPAAVANVVVNPFPTTPTIAAPSIVIANQSGQTASVPNHSGAIYNWTITNGTITNGDGTNQITFTPNASGDVALQVTETNASGCAASAAIATVKIGNYYEADVAPRPNGSLTGLITIADWVQTGRFSAVIDLPTNGSEFQRADCAPRATLGDGKITLADWVQAGRYAAGLDSAAIAGGFTAPVSSLVLAHNEANAALDTVRVIRAVNTVFQRGQLGALQIALDGQGNENAVAFSLNFDHKQLNFVDAAVSNDANGAALQVDKSQATTGRIGFALALPAGQQFAMGARTLLTLRFIPNGGDGDVVTNINFSDQLLTREIVDAFATPIPQVSYAGGAITIRGRAAANVSAASYEGADLAADSIASAFGAKLATMTTSAASLPLPNTLGGTTVKVKDALGVERNAPLFFVSPNQLNYQIPAGTAEGIASVTITNGAGEVTSGLLTISKVAPGLFAADASGKGWAAADVVYVASDGSQTQRQVSRFDVAQNKLVGVPIDLNTEAVVLVLYGTGIRQRSDLANLVVKVGGVAVPLDYAGAQVTYIGLDQVNVRLPKNLLGRGEVDVELSIDGKAANPVRIKIQ